MKLYTTPEFIRKAVHDVFTRLYGQIGLTDEKTNKPLLNSKTVKKLRALKPLFDAIDAGRKISVMMQVDILNTCLQVSEDMSAKLEGINALSTACNVNPVCQARAKDCNSICAHCFAFLTLQRYSGTQQAAIINFLVLNAMVYSKSAWKAVYIPQSSAGNLFRIEAFGDTASTVQAINYTLLAMTHKSIGNFGVWSKNLGFWYIAFTDLGKPSNIVFNASSPVLNTPMHIDPRFAWFVDHVFTVYDCAGAIAGNVNINCGERICANCKRCYTKGNETAVNEILKQESKRYYKAIGKAFTGRH